MLPYRVSVWAPRAANDSIADVRLYGTYAECDDDALRAVSDVMPPDWRIDQITGVLSRHEAESLRLAPGEVRELPLFVALETHGLDESLPGADDNVFRPLFHVPRDMGLAEHPE